MSGDDRILDAALAALEGTATSDPDDDARWAKRVASRITTAAPMSRRELDPILTAPFPDGFKDEDFDQEVAASDDHTDHAAVAADVGGNHGWEGSMSEDSRPPSGLTGLAGLTRSGPSSASELDGHAKADDSGLIDLRAMSETPPPVEEAAPIVSASELSKTLPAAPSALSASKLPVAGVASIKSANAAVPPSSTTATAASAAAAPATTKKKGAGIWIALGGLAAAAAIGLVALPMMSKKDEAPASASKTESPADQKSKSDEKVAAADKAAPTPTAAPTASAAEPAASAAAPDPAATVAAIPKMAAGGSAPAKKDGTPSEPPKPGAKPTATATIDPINKPAGGSLDDVLGIGKDQPAAKKADPTEGLPDKPDSLDVRSAINSKVSAASGCVKGLDAPSSVSVSFGPTGSVSGVAVTSGPAKGTGAEACIKNAFSSAKVPASKKGATGNATLVP